MSLNESIVEEAALEWFPLRQGYGGQVGDQPSPGLRLTGLGYAVGHWFRTLAILRLKPRTGELRVPVAFATVDFSA